jgi:outer membrane protein OmpA-like peptidoglycan-associated protein
MNLKPIIAGLVFAGVLSGCSYQDVNTTASPQLTPISGMEVPAGTACERLVDTVVNKVAGCEAFIPMPALDPEKAKAMMLLNARFASEVAANVSFEFDKDALTAETSAVVKTQADWIRRYPQIRFSVFGHTDLVGSEGYNFDLARRRSEMVVARLIEYGVASQQLDALVSFGETKPIVDVNRPELINRRTLTEVSGYLDSPRLYATVPVNCAWIKAAYLASYPVCVHEPVMRISPPPPPPPPVIISLNTQSWDSNTALPNAATSASHVVTTVNGITTDSVFAESYAGNLNSSAGRTTYNQGTENETVEATVNGKRYTAGPGGKDWVAVVE